MQKTYLKEAVELSVPASRDMMLVLRLTTAGVIARASLTVDRMDDVKMAVEEACNCLIGDEENAPSRLCLRFVQEGSELIIRISGENMHTCRCIPEDESCVIRCILESLVDQVEVEAEGDKVHAVVLRIALGM
ncbi:MAG: hypothetical protein IJA26_03110 [Clostridia bacterium]|nr:hypothetical protein [Clostridia bacterium]